MATAVGVARVERPALTARIGDALDEGSVLLVADAGFGKTAALEDALARSNLTGGWVRCAGAGGDAGRLLGLILSAIQSALPGAADVLSERLLRALEPVDPQLAVLALERELQSLLVDRLVLVLDDAETLDGSAAAVAVIGRLLAGHVDALRLAVAARHPLALPVAPAQTGTTPAVIGPAELTFSLEECRAYLRMARGFEPSPSEVESVLAATSGWPLGVALAARGDPMHAGPSRELVETYFDEEVLSALDPELRDALLAASVAPDLEVAAEAELGPPEGIAAVALRHGIFLSGGEPPRFHPLFGEFLRARFEYGSEAGRRREVHAQIATALEARGSGAAAVEHWLAARDWDAAATAITREGGALARTAPETVERWLEALPRRFSTQPELLLLAGLIAHGAGRLEEAVALCRDAVDGFDRASAPAVQRFAARFALADALVAVGDLDGAAALDASLDDPEATGNVAAFAVGVAAAAGHARRGRFGRARALLARVTADPSAEPLLPTMAGFDGYYFDLPAGRLDDALANVRAGIAALERGDPFGRLPYVLVFLLAIHEERGEEEQALEVAARARAHAADSGLGGWVGVGTAIRSASIRAQRGDVAGAEQDLAAVSPEWSAWGTWDVPVARAAIAARRGESQQARSEAERALREVRPWPYYDQTRCAAVLAPVLVRAGHGARALSAVEETLARRIEGVSTARLHAVRAWLLHDEGDEPASVEALTAAWREAGDQARHLVRREWPRIERPLWVALEHGALDPAAVVAALPAGDALGRFARHPVATVRRAAVLAAASSGHPDALGRVVELVEDSDADVATAARAAAARLRREPPPLAFRVLGGFELRRGSWRVDDAAWERRVAERLVRLLLCRGETVTEDELFEAFWPERPMSSARRGLQVAVSCARAVLDPPGAETSRLEAHERSYRLRLRDEDSVDAADFAAAAAAALGATGEGRHAALSAAVALWGGEPLPEERYSDWAIPWREGLVDRYVELLAALCDEHTHRGDHLAAADAAARMVSVDPLNERAHARLIAAYARAGRRGHALRHFLACRRALVTELGVEPGPEIVWLHRRVLAGEPV